MLHLKMAILSSLILIWASSWLITTLFLKEEMGFKSWSDMSELELGFCFKNHTSNKSLPDWNIKEEKISSAKWVYGPYSGFFSNLEKNPIYFFLSVFVFTSVRMQFQEKKWCLEVGLICLNCFCFSNHISNKSLLHWNIEEEKYSSGKWVYVSYSGKFSNLEKFPILTYLSVLGLGFWTTVMLLKILQTSLLKIKQDCMKIFKVFT